MLGNQNILANQQNPGRAQWQSRFGFIMAATGAAIGLGNLWRFPYLVGSHGGAVFVLVYFVLLVIIGVPLTLTEISLGQYGKSDPYGTYSKISRRMGIFGHMAILCCFIHLCMYLTVGGWVVAYTTSYFLSFFGGAGIAQGASNGFFERIISSPSLSLFWCFLFLLSTIVVVIGGLNKGTERANKFMIPSLFLILLILAVVTLSLPGSSKGVSFYFKPDFTKIGVVTFSEALSQVFFSIGLGMGAMMTYGSYLSKQQYSKRTAIIIPALDTIAALLAGLVIFPAVFAVGMQPSSGQGLMFTTLPEVFSRIPAGNVVALAFFVSVYFAALSSSVSLFEIPLSFLVDQVGMSRRRAIFTLAMITSVCALLPALSLNFLKNATLSAFLGKPNWALDLSFMNFAPFDLINYVVNRFLFPLGGLGLSIAAGWVMSKQNFLAIITQDGKRSFKYSNIFYFIVKYLVPFCIIFIILQSFLLK